MQSGSREIDFLTSPNVYLFQVFKYILVYIFFLNKGKGKSNLIIRVMQYESHEKSQQMHLDKKITNQSFASIVLIA